MFKALLKKQLLELYAGFALSRKTRKKRSAVAIAAYIALTVVLLLLLALAFYAMADALAEVCLNTAYEWFFFGIFGVMALVLSVFGSVRGSYAQLYKPKDNELLLAMPIPPSKILLSRMVGIYLSSLLFSLIVLVPAVIVYFGGVALTPAKVIFPIALIFLLCLLAVALSCLLGWVVALISSRLKSKAFSRVLIALIGIGVYLLFVGKTENFFDELTANYAQISETLKRSLYLFFLYGRACAGEALPMAVWTVGCLLIAALTVFLLSKTFTGFTTRPATATRKAYRERPLKRASVDRALLRREWKRFSASSVYMLNCGLGTILMPVAAIALLFIMGRARAVLEILPVPDGLMPLAALTVVSLLIGFNTITAPAVSLEGRCLYIVQAMPVEAARVLRAKLRLHFLLTYLPSVLLTASLGATLRLGIADVLLVAAFGAVFTLFSACTGLMLNLKRPMLNWTSETVPVKQSVNALFIVLLSMAACAAVAVGGWFAVKLMPCELYFALVIGIFGALCLICLRWLKTRGAAIFGQLN